MRTMASIPSKTENFLHGVNDHTPPFSTNRIVVQPIRGSGVNSVWEFEIPRSGLLHAMQLRVRLNSLYTSELGGTACTAWESNRDSLLAFANVVTNIELYSKQRFIERIAPEAIPYELLNTHSLRTIQAITRCWDAMAAVGDPLPEGMSNPLKRPSLSTVNASANYIEFSIPIPSCSTTSLKKNFQTNFVEALSLMVTTKALPSHHAAALQKEDYYSLQLVCAYHNFHPNVENVIRNSNYETGSPATLPYYDWVKFERRTSPNTATDRVAYSLESDSLVSDLVIVPKYEKASQPSILTVDRNYYVVISSNSEVLYESSYIDMIDALGKPMVFDENDAYPISMQEMDEPTMRAYMPVRLSMRKLKDCFTGGLALSSISNPIITIYANEYVYRNGAYSISDAKLPSVADAGAIMEFTIVGKRHFLLRIDSDTGVMSRTIES